MFRRRSVLLRIGIAAFALWLPAASGKGGKATCVAATSFAKSLTERPHLSCHGDKGAKKKCCCKGEEALRAAACDCHDGQKMFGNAAHDPMIARWNVAPAAGPVFASALRPEPSPGAGRLANAPDPPPPEHLASPCIQA